MLLYGDMVFIATRWFHVICILFLENQSLKLCDVFPSFVISLFTFLAIVTFIHGLFHFLFKDLWCNAVPVSSLWYFSWSYYNSFWKYIAWSFVNLIMWILNVFVTLTLINLAGNKLAFVHRRTMKFKDRGNSVYC